MILLVGLIAWPLVQAVILSFYDVNPLTLISRPVGLANYRELLAGEEFWQALWANLVWVAGSVALQVVVGVALALLLHRRFAGRGFARALLLFPYLLPTVVAVLVWQWMLNDIYGVLDHAISLLGFTAPDWLGEMPDAMISVIVIGSWKLFPFVMIAVLARLQSIPQQIYESAAIDGAGPWARFLDMTLPQLRAVLFVVVLLRAIWDFKEFDLIFLLTGGGPVDSTTTLPLLVYRQAFQLLHLGRASAAAVAMLMIMVALIGLYFAVAGPVRARRRAGVRLWRAAADPSHLACRAGVRLPAAVDDRDRVQAGGGASRHPADAVPGAPLAAELRSRVDHDELPDVFRQQRDRRARHDGDHAGGRHHGGIRAGGLPLPRAPPDRAGRCCSPTCCRPRCC